MRPCRTGHTVIANAILLILVTLGMCACGQKGDLYLPDQDQSAQSGPDKNN
jgi:predicted small lipoprotein YifL